MINIDKKPTILVIGDLMIDSYLIGKYERIAKDAPVPIVDVVKEKVVLGGSGNVIRNLSALGAEVHIMSVVGNDETAKSMKHMLDELETKSFILEQKGRKTSKKTRVVAGNTQLFRIDKESKNNISFDNIKALYSKLQEKINAYDMILLADYGKGVLTKHFTKQIIEYANKHNVKVIVDPFGSDYEKYKGAHIIIVNEEEASMATGIDIDNDDRLLDALKKLKEDFQTDEAIITLAEEGIVILKDDKLCKIPTVPLEVFDVTGSGDTVLASLGFAISLDNCIYESVKFANLATGITLRKFGSATASIEEILSEQGLLDKKTIENKIN